MPSVFLPHRSFLRISGEDWQSFLQNLITTDVDALQQGQATPGALLTPQGKILFDFLIWKESEGCQLEVDASQIDALSRRLNMYKLRAKVDIASEPTPGVTVHWGEEGKANGFEDVRFAKAGFALRRQAGEAGNDDRALYTALRIRHGVAVSGSDFELSDVFPHDVLLDFNGGLSFRKGCYVGQEVVSRMQHRGTARRRVVILSAGRAFPEDHKELTAAGKIVGHIGSIAGQQALAIARIDRIGAAMADGQPISVGDMPVSVSLPEWTGLAFPSSSEEADA